MAKKAPSRKGTLLVTSYDIKPFRVRRILKQMYQLLIRLVETFKLFGRGSVSALHVVVPARHLTEGFTPQVIPNHNKLGIATLVANDFHCFLLFVDG